VAEETTGTREGAQPAGTGTDPVQTGIQGSVEKTLTQADVDRIVKERLGRQKQQYADYDDLKAAAAKLQELEDAQKSELDKTNEQLALLQATNAELLQKQQDLVLRNAITSEAGKLDFADPQDAWQLLDLSAVSINDDGEAEGVANALKTLVEAKPYLVRQQQRTGMSATALQRGGATTEETDEQKRNRIYGGGGALDLGDPALGGGVFMSKEIVTRE